MKKVETDNRRKQVSELYLRRLPQQQIAEQLNISQATVSRDIAYLTKEWEKEASADIKKIRARELTELDVIEREAAIEFRKSRHPRWLDVRLKTKHLRSKLLGINAPEKIDLSGEVKTKTEIDLSNISDDDLEKLEEIIANVGADTEGEGQKGKK